MIYVLAFLGSGLVVMLAGTLMARYADAIAEATALGRLWIGSVLLAGATSLPELTTDIAAVRLGATDLAVGDLFGSSMANMLILAVIDLMPPRRYVLQRATLDHALAATLAISLNAIAALLVLIGANESFLWIGPGSLLLFLAYVLRQAGVQDRVFLKGAHVDRDLCRAPRRRVRRRGSVRTRRWNVFLHFDPHRSTRDVGIRPRAEEVAAIRATDGKQEP